ncbi:MAG: hypothetical protein ORN85_02225 [Sediminibacterium sp.]|nr:hypothetical protein [Sediminibacterium sp.]
MSNIEFTDYNNVNINFLFKENIHCFNHSEQFAKFFSDAIFINKKNIINNND